MPAKSRTVTKVVPIRPTAPPHDGPPPDRSTLPKIARRRSPVHGYGVFAAQPITKNTRIIDYAGELIWNVDSVERETKYLEQGCIWVFRVNRRWSRDAAVNGNIARFINHACEGVANCYFQVIGTTIWIRAARNIAEGEELTYDYRTVGDKTIPCRCRPGCTARL